MSSLSHLSDNNANQHGLIALLQHAIPTVSRHVTDARYTVKKYIVIQKVMMNEGI